ncbi:MAG TPA: DUF87 domain-containing protein [bacterium]|nr:DUF87 domain-containing protein [bacterium]
MLLSSNFNPQNDPNAPVQDPVELERRQREQAELLAKAGEKAPKTGKEVRQLAGYEETYKEGMVTILDLVAPAYMEVDPRYLRLGNKYLKTIFVVGYPRYLTVGWFSPIINMSVPLDIGMYFYPLEISGVLEQMQRKVGILQAQLSEDAEKGAPRDPVREVAYRDLEQLRDDITQGKEKFFQFALYVTIYADDLKGLEQITSDVEQVFATKLIITKPVFYQSEQGFNSTMPLGNDELLISFNMNSSPIAASFPFMSADLSSDKGILYGINRHNNSLIIFDRFSMPNANMVVFATSGAGKSYAVKLEILRSLMMGTDVIVIDPEMEYRDLCDAVGGTYINVSLSSRSKINPFDLPRPTGESTSTEDILRSSVITLKGLLRLMLGDLTHEEDALLDRALLESYAKKDINAQSDLSRIEPPTMMDLESVLDGMVGGDNLKKRLSKFTTGTFSGLFTSLTNVNMANQLVIFSVRDLEDELRPIGIYTIVNYIWNVVRSERKKRILVIDEAWWLMQRDDSAKFIFALVKRCRKYYLGITTISQDVNDFLLSPYGRAIVTNSAMQLLLKQSTAAIENVQKTFMLTEGEKYLLLESAVGEGIFFAGQNHAAIKIIASPTEDQLVTTNPEQLLQKEAAKSAEAANVEEIEI